MSSNNDNQESDYTFRIVVVGDPAVGKTSLTSRFVDNAFLSETISTNGAPTKTRILPFGKKSVQLNIMDTCGQELFRTVSRSIYHNADAVIVVYDQGNEKSFTNVQFWLREVDAYSNNPNCHKTIVGNKTDSNKLVVTPDTGREYAINLGLPFFDTSAKEDSNVDVLFQAVVQAVGNKKHQNEDWNKVKVARNGPRESSSSSGLSTSGSTQNNKKKASFCTLRGMLLMLKRSVLCNSCLD